MSIKSSETQNNIWNIWIKYTIYANIWKTIVMDTKWKRLTDDPYANYGIAQSDMYQMYAYAKKI